MKTLTTLLAISQGFEEPLFSNTNQLSEALSALNDAEITTWPYKKVHVSTCLEKYGALDIKNVKIECNLTKGKGNCELKGCNDGYLIANRYKYAKTMSCYTDASESLVMGFFLELNRFSKRLNWLYSCVLTLNFTIL